MIKAGLPTSRHRNLFLGNGEDSGILFQWANTSLPDLTSADRAIGFQSTAPKYWNGTSWAAFSSGGGYTTWDELYANDKTLTINSTALTFALTHATNNGLTLTGSGGSAGHVIQITNAGSGNDINGTSDTWSVTKGGLATFTTGSVLGGTTKFGTGSAAGTITSNGNFDLVLKTGNATTMTATFIDGANGDIDIAMNGTGKIDISGTTTHNDALKVGAGDVLVSLGHVDITDDQNAESLLVTNATATTVGAVAAGGVVAFDSASLTTGVLLDLQLTEGTLAGGYYLRAWDVTGGSGVFSVGENGVTTIAGAASGTTAFAITAGDVVMSDGVVSVTNTADSASLTIVADAATTVNVVDINADGLTTGAILHLDTSVAGMGVGSFIDCYNGAASVFNVKKYGAVTIAGNAATDVFTITAGHAVVTAGDVTLTNGSVSVTNTADETAMTVVADAVTTNIVLDINADAITSGTILHLDTSVAGMTTGLFIDCYDGAASAFSVGKYGAVVVAGNAATNVFTVTAGDLVVSDGSLTITDADEASTVSITNNTAASVSVIAVTANSITDGDVLKLESSAAGMTTGNFINCYNGATTVFEVGLYGAVTIAGNAATNVFTITAGHAVLTSGNLTLTSGNAVLTSGNLTLTAGNALLTSGNLTLTAGNIAMTNGDITLTDGYIVGTPETRSGPGAIDVSHLVTEVITTGADALTLANGVNGQLKVITMITDGGEGTLTPTSPLGYATIKFNDVGDSVILIYVNSGWQILSNNGCTVA